MNPEDIYFYYSITFKQRFIKIHLFEDQVEILEIKVLVETMLWRESLVSIVLLGWFDISLEENVLSLDLKKVTKSDVITMRGERPICRNCKDSLK